MNTGLNQGSAKIYQFPVGGRSSLGMPRLEEATTDADRASSPEIVWGNAWYHEVAIMEINKPSREH